MKVEVEIKNKKLKNLKNKKILIPDKKRIEAITASILKIYSITLFNYVIQLHYSITPYLHMSITHNSK